MPRPPIDKDARSAQIHLRVSAAEKRRMEKAAKRARVSLSQWLLDLAREAVGGEYG